MALGIGSIGFGVLAGVFSTLSPCVLPILPLVFSGAATAHRFGMAALAAGLVTSFVVIGLFVATIGFSIGLDGGVFRAISAVILLVLGMILLSERLQARFAMATGSIANAANTLTARISPSGLAGQFTIGAILGAVWSPCVGPTLGAASLLAAQGQNLLSVAAVMIAFGLGTAVPLLIIALLSRQAMSRWRGGMLQAGKTGKTLLGAGAVMVGLLIVTGADRAVETALVDASPEWLTDLTTRF